MSEIENTSDVAKLTVQLLSAYLSNNTVASDELSGLVRSTMKALTDGPAPSATQQPPETLRPAVSVRKSLASPEHIVSMIDGKSYKTLKRHLSANGMTPAEYRNRYGLPASYPMVAPEYSARRRDVAQKVGLGSRKPEADPQVDDASTDAGKSIEREVSAPTFLSRGKGGQPKSALSKRTAASGKVSAPVSNDSEAQETGRADPEMAPAAAEQAISKPIRRKSGSTPAKRQGTQDVGGKPALKSIADAAKSGPSADARQLSEAGLTDLDQAHDGRDKSVPAKAKRRGKIGLFSSDSSAKASPKPQAGGAGQAGSSSSEAAPEVMAAKAPATPSKQSKPKRMARAPKPNKAGNTE